MPFIEAPARTMLKRKRQDVPEETMRRRPSIVRRPSPTLATESLDIKRLEDEIQQSRKNYNNVATLIAHAFRTGSKDCKDAAILALCRTFSRFLAEGSMQVKEGMKDTEVALLKWLQKKFSDFCLQLASLIYSKDLSSNLNALQLCMRIAKQEVRCVGTSQWTEGMFPLVLRGLSRSLSTTKSFVQEYFKYDDVRYHTALLMPDIAKSAIEASKTAIMNSLLEILLAFPSPPEANAEFDRFFAPKEDLIDGAAFTRKSYIRKVQDAWIVVLGLPMTKRQRKAVLGLFVHQIVPWFPQPERFMDFLTDSYNEGGETTLLALSGLFHLMQARNLDYPSFYTKLYSLLDDHLLHSKHRSRFFRLLDVFMASTHLPAALVASFIKRLSRLALQAPPSGIVIVVPWIYNTFQNHPSTTFLMHRTARCKEETHEWDAFGAEDTFDETQSDPMLTGAIDSSIWELQTLQSHYHPNVATLAKIISEQFTKQHYNLEDFLDLSYDSLLHTELDKPLKKSAVVEYVIPPVILQDQAEQGPGLDALWKLVTTDS